jgi:EamA domain-containing membrane protein RarD
MRLFASIILGLIGGFILGIALSSVIGIISVTVFDEPFGIKYLSYFTAVICAVAVPIIDQKSLQNK